MATAVFGGRAATIPTATGHAIVAGIVVLLLSLLVVPWSAGGLQSVKADVHHQHAARALGEYSHLLFCQCKCPSRGCCF